MKARPIILAASLAAATATACVPPPAAHALIQRTACNTAEKPPYQGACVHWVNHNAAWQYPPNTEWIGPLSDYEYDHGWHGIPPRTNGAELLP